MKRYVATVVITLHAGLLDLNEDQARRRKHLVVKVGDCWKILKSVQFKIGEEFGYDGDIPKGMADNLAEVEDLPQFPVHKGAGVWELSNGERVKGKGAAFEAEAGLAGDAG